MSDLEKSKKRKAMEYCEICFLSWEDLCDRYSCMLEMDLKRSHIHDALAALFDVDRNFIEKALELAEETYGQTNEMARTYDTFLNYLNEISKKTIRERHPDFIP